MEKNTMKKILVCFAVAFTVSMFTGCSLDGASSWCRSGSLFPSSRSKEKTEKVYLTSGVQPCNPSTCQPCEPTACSPCEPACNPCEPICNPCDVNCVTGVVSRGITTPHVAN